MKEKKMKKFYFIDKFILENWFKKKIKIKLNVLIFKI